MVNVVITGDARRDGYIAAIVTDCMSAAVILLPRQCCMPSILGLQQSSNSFHFHYTEPSM